MNFTPLQQQIYDVIQNAGEIYIGEIAKDIYKSLRKDLKPLNPNNSVICAINQINLKYPNTIKGINRGSKGKLVYLKGRS